MFIEVITITLEQVNRILKYEESHFIDLKSIDIKPAKLSKSISAFANANGGELLIGICEYTEENKKVRRWEGLANQEAANGHLQTFESLFPLGFGYSYTFLRSENHPGLVLQVTILKSREIARTTDDKIYLRRGAQDLPVDTPEKLNRLKLDKGIDSYEKRNIDVDLVNITNSITIKSFVKNVVPSSEPNVWLEKQQLIIKDKPTVAGILLFSDEPQAILPKHCGVKIYRYKTKDNEGSRASLDFVPITIEGCLYEQINQSIQKTIEIVESIPKLGEQGLESISYPQEAIHEIIANALLHRDYSIPSDTHIRIYDNRIEIESPGKLPGHITSQNILKEQYSRNGAIVRIINKFPNPPNKDVGEGLNTAFQAMASLRLQPPKIEELEASVIVYIKHELLASIESVIMSYLDKNPEITNKIAKQETGVNSAETIKSVFDKLRNRGLIELIPGRSKVKAGWCKAGELKKVGYDEQNLKSDYHKYPAYEEIIMAYLIANEEINNTKGREILGVESGKTVKNILYRLRDKEMIEIMPNRSRLKAGWRKIIKKNDG
jgi:ATP-dependent DNA helicase RecG